MTAKSYLGLLTQCTFPTEEGDTTVSNTGTLEWDVQIAHIQLAHVDNKNIGDWFV